MIIIIQTFLNKVPPKQSSAQLNSRVCIEQDTQSNMNFWVYPCYGAVMSLVSNLVKFHDCSIVWEISVQFF